MNKDYKEFTDKEQKWIGDFKKVMAKAPRSLFLFVGAGVTIFAKDEQGKRYMTAHGSVDSEATSTGISTKMECDGGDF